MRFTSILQLIRDYSKDLYLKLLKTGLAALTFVSLLLVSNIAHATSPYASWRVLESEHFEVFYDKPQKALAEKYLRSAEESYKILSTVFSDLPKKTVLVLDDSTDLTNGSATFLPYDWIQIYPSLPDPGDSLDHYGDWPKVIVIHELTHIANFQPVNGAYVPLSFLFGSIVTPNSFLPRWYLEGIAVHSESVYTQHGRLRAPRTQGIVRTLTLSGGFSRFGIDQINEVGIKTWPYGERPYLFGSLLQKSLVDKGTKDIRERWNQRYGNRFPFLIEAVPKDDFKATYGELLDETYKDLQDKATRQIQDIKKDGAYEPKSFQTVDHEQLSPKISPDGKKLVYISKTRTKTSFWLIERDSIDKSFTEFKANRLFTSLYPQSLSWNKSGSGFYFDAIDGDTPFVNHRRIYFYDLEKKRTSLITPKSRARYPIQSPSGRRLAFVTESAGFQQLEWMEGGSKRASVLYKGKLSERISSPFFVSEDKLGFVSKHPDTGVDSVLTIGTGASDPELLLKSQSQSVRFPNFARDNVWFLSHVNGIDNIYSQGLNEIYPKAHTNTLTWIHSFANDHDKLIVSQMTLNGLRLYESKIENYNLTKKDPLVTFKEDKDAAQNPSSKNPSEATQEIAYKEKGAYPFKYLVPRYWVPFIYPVEGGVIIQGSTSATDPVAVNLYSLAGSYDTVTKGSSYGMFFQNNSFSTSIDLYGLQFQEYLGASDELVETKKYGGLLSQPLGFLSKRWRFGLGYSRGSSERSGLGESIKEGPEALLSFSNLGDPRVSNGSSLQLGFDKFLDGPNRTSFDRTSFALGQKFSFGFSEDHYLWTSLKGAFNEGLSLNQLLEFGDPSLGGNYLVNLVNSQFLFRGYPSGTFVGRQTLNSNLEYRFPISEPNRGSGTRPLFFKTLNAAAFVDILAVDGAYYKPPGPYRRAFIEDFHFSTGGELHLDTTLAYHLPLTLILGGYWGLSDKVGSNFTIFTGIGSLDPLGQQIRAKSP